MTLRLNGDSSGFTEIKAPNTAGDNSITLPTSNGGANQLLKNGGTAGELEYTSAGGGLHYDSSGRLLVGEANSVSTNCYLQLVGNPANNAGAELYLGRREAATKPLTVNQSIGDIRFGDNAGNVFANISSKADGTSGTDDFPGRLEFSTTGDGSNSLTPRVGIGSNGALKLLAGCPGIDFSAIQTNSAGMDSETLNGYETGSFTPTVGGHSGMGTITYKNSGTYGRYVRVGHYVTIMGQVHVDIKSSNPSGNFRIRGLPFAPFNNNLESRGIGVITTEDGGVDYVHLCIRGAFIDGNGLVGTAVTLKPSASNDDGFVEPSGSAFINDDFKARFSLTYRIA